MVDTLCRSLAIPASRPGTLLRLLFAMGDNRLLDIEYFDEVFPLLHIDGHDGLMSHCAAPRIGLRTFFLRYNFYVNVSGVTYDDASRLLT